MIMLETHLEVSLNHEVFILWVFGLEDLRRQTHLAQLPDRIDELIRGAGELGLEEGEPEDPGLV